MGLTVHFRLAAPPGTDAAGAREFVCVLRRRAQGFKQRGRVDRVLPVGAGREALRCATQFKPVPHPSLANTWSGIEIPAEEGFVFPVAVGEGCEPLWLGLCRYPKTVLLGGRRYRSGLPGWLLHGFSKTQYASLRGWEHFRRCHTAVVDLLAGARRSGLAVKIDDEGEYWPGRDVQRLRRNLDRMNAIVAASAGVLKDWGEAGEEIPVRSPILAHPQFERMEAEGDKLGFSSRLRKLLRPEG